MSSDDIYWIEGRPLEKGRNIVVARATAPGLKYKAALSVAYGAGLRAAVD